MSHFAVLVIGPDPAAQLQPFHEFECTGTDDQYVQNIDITKDVTEEFQAHRAEYKNIADFVREWHGITCQVELGTAPGEACKYGYAEHMPGAPWNLVRVINRTNPNAKWDWWVLGGRWCGFFPVKPDISADELASIKAGQGAGAATWLLPKRGKADQLRVSQVDFDAARPDAEEEALALFDRWERLITEHGRARGWDECRAAHPEDIDAARTAYNAQPLVTAAKADKSAGGMGFRLACWIDELGYDRTAYVTKRRNGALVPYAVVYNGKWMARGDMGWFGCSDDKVSKPDWCEQVSRLYDDLPPDTLLTLVDCHI